jgi:hypothetical protein
MAAAQAPILPATKGLDNARAEAAGARNGADNAGAPPLAEEALRPGSNRRPLSNHHDPGSYRNPLVKVLDMVVDHPDAAVRNGLADGPGLGGAMDPVERVAPVAKQIESPGAQRVLRPARYAPGIAGIFLRVAGKAVRVGKRLRAGMVRLNGVAIPDAAPSGGYKSSGVGREGGRLGLDEFLEVKTWAFSA